MGTIKMKIDSPRAQEIFAGLLAALGREGLRADVLVTNVYEVEIDVSVER
jgi:hypothetical protein